MNVPSRIDQAARLLADLHRPGSGPRPRSLPPELSPRNQQEAYDIQRATARLLEMTAGAWKVAMSESDRGTWAPIFAAHVYRSPARVPCVMASRLGIEPEIAFTLKRDLPRLPPGESYTRAQLIGAIEAAYAAIEIVVSRFGSHESAEPIDRLADNISNGGLVLSEANQDWQRLDLSTIALRLHITNADHGRSEHLGGGHPLGDPLTALLWLVNDRAAAGHGIRAGEPVTTGSYAGLLYAASGSEVIADFAGLGTARLEVS